MTEKQKNSKVKIGIGIGCLAAVLVILAVIYSLFSAKTTAGSKNITIEVVNKASESTMYEVSTDAEYLKEAMEETEGLTFEGTESEYGMMVDTVNGEKADYNIDGSYWSFYVNGEYCNYGIDAQPIADQDAFQIVYTTDFVQ